MKYCPHCGKELVDDATFCTGCGRNVTDFTSSTSPSTSSEKPAQYGAVKNDAMSIVIKIFLILTLAGALLSAMMYFIAAAVGGPFLDNIVGSEAAFDLSVFAIISGIFSLVPLAWVVPMTITIWRKLDKREPMSTALKVCTLLFVNLIAGILLLCRTEPTPQNY